MFCDELSKLLPKCDNNKYLVLAEVFDIDVSNKLKPGVLCYVDTLSAFGLENTIQDYTREEHYDGSFNIRERYTWKPNSAGRLQNYTR